MMKKNYFLTFIFALLATVKCFADGVDGFPNEPGKEKELSKLIGEAYVWNHYWYNDWRKDFDKVFKVGKKEKIGVCFADNKSKEEKGYRIFFDKLPADMTFFKQNNSWYAPDVVGGYCDDERTSRKESLREYLDFKAKQTAPLKEFWILLGKDVFGVLNFGPFGEEKKKFIERVFLDRILKGNDLKFIQKCAKRDSKTGIVIKVGNFNFKYPVFYYYIEGLNSDKGMPFLGYVNFDTETKKIFFDDLISSEVPPVNKKYEQVIKRIDQTGMTFKYINGRFVES